MTIVRLFLTAAVISFATNVAAQNPTYPGQPGGSPPAASTTAAAQPGVRTMRASRRTGDIHIDGKLDEPAWAASTPSMWMSPVRRGAQVGRARVCTAASP